VLAGVQGEALPAGGTVKKVTADEVDRIEDGLSSTTKDEAETVDYRKRRSRSQRREVSSLPIFCALGLTQHRQFRHSRYIRRSVLVPRHSQMKALATEHQCSYRNERKAAVSTIPHRSDTAANWRQTRTHQDDTARAESESSGAPGRRPGSSLIRRREFPKPPRKASIVHR
jgi:hypothetical protein